MSQKTTRKARRAAKSAPKALKTLTPEQRIMVDPQVHHVNAVKQQAMTAINSLDQLLELIYPGFLKGGVEYNADLGGFYPAGSAAKTQLAAKPSKIKKD